MVTLNCNFFQIFYFRCLSENLITILLGTQNIMGSKKQEMKIIISLSVILHYVECCHPNLKMAPRYKVMCGLECFISAKTMNSSLLSWCDCYSKNLRISEKMLKTEGLGEKKIAYTKLIKIQLSGR